MYTPPDPHPSSALLCEPGRHGRSSWRWLLWALAWIGTLPAWAATQTVTNTNDSGPGSLRQAITSASSGDTIQFSLPNPSTITLSSTLTISTNLTINGSGAAQLALSGNHLVRVFAINAGVTAAISGVTIENGSATDNAPFGGAVYNVGTLTVTNCTLSGNSATGGGALANFDNGKLTVMNSTLSGNSAGYGGAIDNEGTFTLNNSTISSNSTTGAGGGIYNFANTLTVNNSTVSGNSSASDGGGILNLGTLILNNSTISGNSATREGGGIWNNIGDVAGAFGTVTLSNDTISGNSASDGGGIYNYIEDKLTIKGTLLAGSTGGNCTFVDISLISSQGYNLSDDNTCASGLTAATDKHNVAAGLDPKGLQNNGGSTQTVALLSTSPAVDAIPVASCTDTSGNLVKTDQRGITRPQGSACDVGAFELVENFPFSSFSAQLELATGKHKGFNLTARFMLAAGQTLTPLTESVTLTVGSYSVTLPAGSFHQLQIGPFSDYGYLGTVKQVSLDVQIIPLGSNSYGLQAAGTPVTLVGSISAVPVTLTFGNNTGTTTVTPLLLP